MTDADITRGLTKERDEPKPIAFIDGSADWLATELFEVCNGSDYRITIYMRETDGTLTRYHGTMDAWDDPYLTISGTKVDIGIDFNMRSLYFYR